MSNSYNLKKPSLEDLKENGCDVDVEFYNQHINSYTNWNTKFNTIPIPDGMTFDDFTPQLTLGISPYPSTCSLKNWMPDPLNQGNTGACIACVITNAIQFWYDYTKMDSKPQRSILFIYYNARYTNACCYSPDAQPSVNTDSGSNLCAAIQAIAKYGACDDSFWPFVESNVTVKPSNDAYNNGQMSNQIVETRQINQDLKSIQHALCYQKYPVCVGINVYSSYLDITTIITGNIPYPKPNELELNVGHAVLLVGYDDSTRLFSLQNSYGTTGWGDNGYGTIPYEYILNPALTPNDLWIVGNGVSNLPP